MKSKIAFSTIPLRAKIADAEPLWADFTRSFRNLELSTIDIANEIYTGHAFTTWHKNQWRHSSNYQAGQHIGLDFDTGDEQSTLAYLVKDKFVSKYAALIYTTPSHQPHAPRARLLFLLDHPIYQAQNYVQAVKSLLWLFGTADAKCKDTCRLFYGSIGCEVEYLDNRLPLAKLKEIIAQSQQEMSASGPRPEGARRERETPLALHDVAEALGHIPVHGIDYNQWLAVLMGIHNEFGTAGLPLAEAWGAGTPGEIERKWRSFSKTAATSRCVTIATLFSLAQKHGWRKGGMDG